MGWHVPSDTEWTIMEKYLVLNGYNWNGSKGPYNKIAKSLAAKTAWIPDTNEGTIGCDLTLNNRTGFSALGSGFRFDNGSFCGQSAGEIWWSATESSAPFAYSRELSSNDDNIFRGCHDKMCGFSVRLLKD